MKKLLTKSEISKAALVKSLKVLLRRSTWENVSFITMPKEMFLIMCRLALKHLKETKA